MRPLPFLLAVALAGCGGHAKNAADAPTTEPQLPRAVGHIVDAFGEHGEALAVEPDLTGDDFEISFDRPWLPRPLVLLSRSDGDGNLIVYVYRSPADVETVTSTPRTELVFRPAWQLLHRSNVLVITVAQGTRRERIAAALDDLR